MLEFIPEGLPGLHVVDYCVPVNRLVLAYILCVCARKKKTHQFNLMHVRLWLQVFNLNFANTNGELFDQI